MVNYTFCSMCHLISSGVHVHTVHFVCASMLTFTKGHLADCSKKQSTLKVDTFDLHCKADTLLPLYMDMVS